MQTSGDGLAKNAAARELVTMLRKKITLEKLCIAFNDYIEVIYPREELSYEEFDSIFSPLLNNTQPLFKALSER